MSDTIRMVVNLINRVIDTAEGNFSDDLLSEAVSLLENIMTDMEYNHCGACGKYVSPEDGFHGAAERDDGDWQHIYCNEACCKKAEPELFNN